jgi:hypothetical protein
VAVEVVTVNGRAFVLWVMVAYLTALVLVMEIAR